MWKWLLAAFLLCAAVCGAGGYFAYTSPRVRDWTASLRPQERGTEVRIEAARRGDLTRTVSAPGRVEPKTKVDISAQVVARVTALPFREGDEVKAGDVVVRLDAREYSAQLESAQAGLKSEQARLEGTRAALVRAEQDLRRQRGLYETKDVAASTIESAESEQLRALSQRDAAEHAVEIARANIVRVEKDLDNTVIKSPMDGTIVKLNAEVGELVVVGTLNSPGSVILTVADLGTMLMKARVDEANIGPVRQGQRAKVYVNAYPDRTIPGVVERVKLQRQQEGDGTAYFETEILLELNAGERLYSGLTANTDIAVETMQGVVRVPSQAVVDRRVDDLPKGVAQGQFVEPGKAFARVVYRVVEGKAAATAVSVGSSDLTQTVIIGGLNEGEAIVTGPYKILADLKDGRSVVDQEEARMKKAQGARH